MRVVGSVDDVDAEAWDEAVDRLGGSVYHRHGWLRALERGGVVDAAARHIVVTDGADRVIALAPCYLTRRCPKLEMFRQHYVTSPLAGTPTAVVHSMYAQTSEILAESETTRTTILDELERLCRTGPVEQPLLFPLVAAEDPLYPLLASRGYALGLTSCTNLLDVTWDSFDEYLASRPSAKRRNILRGIRRSEDTGVTVAVGQDGAAIGPLAAMAAQTAEQHRSPVFFDESYLGAIFDNLPTEVVTFTIRAGADLLLTCLALEHAGELTPWCVGLDYSNLNRYDHYNYLYVSLIRHAIKRRLRVVNFGRSTYVIKRKYGCAQRPVFTAVATSAGDQAAARSWVGAIDAHARAELSEVGLPQPPPVLAPPDAERSM